MAPFFLGNLILHNYTDSTSLLLLLVTAGHCGTGSSTFYAGLGNTTIGSMVNSSESGSVDAGVIPLNSSTTMGVSVTGTNLTIGTFDYNQARQKVGNKVYLSARSGTHESTIRTVGGNTGDMTDMIFVNPTDSRIGDSGGLWYTKIVKGNKTYAVIEGIVHGGVYRENADGTLGEKVYDVFSRLKNIYDYFEFSGIYVDSSYPG